jgi:uncharacterized protein
MVVSITETVAGEVVELLADRAVYWPKRKTLLVADLHWGKSEYFQRQGIPVPSDVLHYDLNRLAKLIERTGSERVMILGDLIHNPKGISDHVIETVSLWRQRYALPLHCIRGNHDRQLKTLPKAWDISWVDGPLFEDGFCFRHEPETTPNTFSWCGHIHPVLRLGDRKDSLRMPCFWLGKDLGVLPSFGFFTGGFKITPQKSDRVFLVDSEQIFALHESDRSLDSSELYS